MYIHIVATLTCKYERFCDILRDNCVEILRIGDFEGSVIYKDDTLVIKIIIENEGSLLDKFNLMIDKCIYKSIVDWKEFNCGLDDVVWVSFEGI
jgi:hypothetical protein